MNTEDALKLEAAIGEITEIAQGFGLDFYEMRYEICPADIIYTFGAYGMPTRYSHWSFGKNFHRMKTHYDFGLSKIYELVINSDPCYAFLLDGNSLIQNKLIVAHVLAHSDFFKNNSRFSRSNRSMVESMSASAERIRQYELRYGSAEVEQLLDAILAIQEHVDPSLIGRDRRRDERDSEEEESKPKPNRPAPGTGGYEDLWDLEKKETGETGAPESPRRFPSSPEKDLLWFLQEHAPGLKEWQRDILTMLRDEMLYFWPQLETKIMNEGWASYWHVRILREMNLTSDETVEFAKLNASVIQPSRHSLNPYYFGLKLFEDIERRWDRDKLFEVRELDSDVSFIRSYLTKELVGDLDLYVFEKKGAEWKITDKAWEQVRDQLVYSRINGGFPFISVQDGNFDDNGELYLKQGYEGIELDLKYVERTLPYVHRLWGRTVHLETVIEEKPVLFSFDGKKIRRNFM